MISLSAEQAKAIAEVLRSADGYCTKCARDLADQMAVVCPGHDWRGLCGVAQDDDEAPTVVHCEPDVLYAVYNGELRIIDST